MKYSFSIAIITCCFLLSSSKTVTENWIKKTGKSYNLNFTSKDKHSIKEYDRFIAEGMAAVVKFFDTAYRNKYEVFIHPNRQSLDSSWQTDWKMPQFKSECWMVASGVAKRIDIISPKTWDNNSCEHKYADKEKTQKLITHELVHVFHGQQNVSPDFSNAEHIDWFVEGLASYASGQCDSIALAQVKELVDTRTFPKTLDIFWTGKSRYAVSGSMVMYIDKNYGRKMLMDLLKLNKKKDILAMLEATEEQLLAGWAKYFR